MAAPMRCVLYLCLWTVYVSCFDEDEFQGSRTFTLEHSFDQGPDPVFTKRGTVVIQSVQSNMANFSPLEELSSQDKKTLKRLAGEDGIYRIRIPIRETEEGTVYVSTFSKACAIYESHLSDTIIISIDQSGEVFGVSMATDVGYCNGVEVSSANLSDWNTKVLISVSVSGPLPDTQTYIDRKKKEDAEKAQGAQADNRSFFGKYWMYIVPFVILMFVMQSVDPNQGGGGGGGAGR